MFKKHIIFPLIISAGFFGPFFASISEGRTKNISLEHKTEARQDSETKLDARFPVKKSEQPDSPESHECADSEELYQRGKASWYGPGFHGRKMANGHVFNMHNYTVAHRELPFGTRLCINNPENGKWVLATVTDRGPYIQGRIVDLSKQVALDLEIVDTGVATVRIYLENT